MSYHVNEIDKGVLGEFSKIKEEFQELQDAVEQEDRILQICELTDLIGAIEEFSNSKFRLTLMDLITFSNKTKSAFREGKRK